MIEEEQPYLNTQIALNGKAKLFIISFSANRFALTSSNLNKNNSREKQK